MQKYAIHNMKYRMTDHLANRALLVFGAVCLASIAYVSPVLAAPQDVHAASHETAHVGKQRARDCIKQRMSRDGRQPSSKIQLTTIGPGIPTWFMFANANTFRYSIFNKDVCVKNLFTIARWDLLAAKPLSYPASCSRRELVAYAKHCGLFPVPRGGYIFVKRSDGSIVTKIPHTVKSNHTCKQIIKELKDECEKSAHPPGPNPP